VADGWTVVEVVGAATGAVVLLGGAAAVVAGLYGRKANPSLDVSAIARPDGRVVLFVRATVSAPGVRPIRVTREGDHTPFVRVVEALDGVMDGPIRYGHEYRSPMIFGGGVVGPGETASKTELFYQPPPAPDLIGWSVVFVVDVPRLWPTRRGWWTWAANAFVPMPTDGGGPGMGVSRLSEVVAGVILPDRKPETLAEYDRSLLADRKPVRGHRSDKPEDR
jgi:hypothetical protein